MADCCEKHVLILSEMIKENSLSNKIHANGILILKIKKRGNKGFDAGKL